MHANSGTGDQEDVRSQRDFAQERWFKEFECGADCDAVSAIDGR